MTAFQTAAERLANNVLKTNQSNYAGDKTGLQVEYLVQTFHKAFTEDGLNISREQLSSFVSEYLEMTQGNNEALHLTLQKKMVPVDYLNLERSNYEKLFNYVVENIPDLAVRSVVLGCLTAADTDSLRITEDSYYVDECQHFAIVTAREKWYLKELGVSHMPFAVFYNKKLAELHA